MKGYPEKALKGYKEGRRPAGKPRGRWIHAVDRHAKRMLKCKNWEQSAEDRGVWRRRIERPRPKLDCSTIIGEEGRN
jgi:hypothetical protein